MNSKKQVKEDREVIYHAIVDRDGVVPKTEKKRMTKEFLMDFLNWLTIKYPDNKKSVVDHLFKDYGEKVKISPNNIRIIGEYTVVFRYCKISRRLSKTDICSWLSSNGETPDRTLELWTLAIAYIILSDQNHNPNHLYAFYEAYKDITRARQIGLTALCETFKSIRKMFKVEGIDFTAGVKERFILTMIHMYESLQLPRLVYDPMFKEALTGYIFEDDNKGIAFVLPKYYNPFTAEEYLTLCINNGIEVDDEIKPYLDSFIEEIRMEWIKQAVGSNGNNIKLCKNASERSACIPYLSWDDEVGCITNYALFREVFPNGCSHQYITAFLKYGDLSTVPSDEFHSLFVDAMSIGYVSLRDDSVKQFENLLRIPNGMTFLVDAIDMLPPNQMNTFMQAYVNYMESINEPPTELPGSVSMDIYMASYIKKRVSIGTMIKYCPKMLRYIDTAITDLPSEYDNLGDWVSVASNTPVSNICDGLQFNQLMKVWEFVPLNYHRIPFSPGLFGLEEIGINGDDMIKLLTLHPGYYFDIKDSKIRSLVMDVLTGKFADKE